MSTVGKPPARPLFRKLALGVAVVCFALAAVTGLTGEGDGLFGPLVCLAVGFVMAAIGVTGYWPPARPKP
jgi:hypothetical protein